MTRRNLTALLLLALLATAAAWGIGFAAFEQDAKRPAPPPPPADGIVALTGGADRVDTALRLLAEKRAPLLLVSGVARGIDRDELLRHAAIDPASLADRVTLGHSASTTVGNAAETAAWADLHGLRRIIVVTAGYHMQRAMLEIARRLPDATLYPAPVQPPAMRDATFGTLRLLAIEYNKLLAARAGLGVVRKEAWR